MISVTEDSDGFYWVSFFCDACGTESSKQPNAKHAQTHAFVRDIGWSYTSELGKVQQHHCPICTEARWTVKKESDMVTENGKPKKLANPKKPAGKVEKVVRTLRCDLTEKEVRERSDRAAHVVAQRDQREAEAKLAAQHMKNGIKELDTELRKLSTEVRDKACMRQVECEVRFDYQLGRVFTRRLDTKVVIEERPMHDFERQTDLPLESEPEEATPEAPPVEKPKRGRPRKKKPEETIVATPAE